jgi:hypothetical protein
MIKNIKDLPLSYQNLLAEFQVEKDVKEGIATDYVVQPNKEDVQDEYERLESVIEEEGESEYDEHDENTYDMTAISPYMRDAFDDFSEEEDFDED